MNDDALENAQSHARRGALLVQSGRLTDALASFQKAVLAAPADAVNFVNLANVYLLLGRLDEALVPAERALQVNPRLAQALVTLSAVHLRRNEPEKALTQSRLARRLDPLLREPRF